MRFGPAPAYTAPCMAILVSSGSLSLLQVSQAKLLDHCVRLCSLIASGKAFPALGMLLRTRGPPATCCALCYLGYRIRCSFDKGGKIAETQAGFPKWMVNTGLATLGTLSNDRLSACKQVCVPHSESLSQAQCISQHASKNLCHTVCL